MRSTLFYVPHADPWLHLPVFGFGWLLAIWCIASIAILAWSYHRHGWSDETRGNIPLLLVLGAAIIWVGPRLEQVTAAGVTLGIPIRGYGVMVLLGVVCGMGLVSHEARRVGVDSDIIMSVAFWMFAFGIIGARMFYVIEYWNQFARPTWQATFLEILKLTDGGLVVYGSLFGAVLAATWYLICHKLPALAIADLLAMGMALGVVFGRIGCFLNGCCYGAVCDSNALGVTFPQGSPPFLNQLERGVLVGMQLERVPGRPVWIVRSVTPGSLADKQQIKPGNHVVGIGVPGEEVLDRMRHGEFVADALVSYAMEDGRRTVWRLGDLPHRTRSVYPTQILSSINAAVICWFLWAFYPFRRKDGQVFALLMTIYPLTRFLLEMIRSDEPSVLPTDFKMTISQTVSVIVISLIVALWIYIISRPRGSVLPVAKS